MEAPAPIGHNKPPSDIELLREKLTTKYLELRAGAKGLAEQTDTFPKEITTEDQASQVTDLISEINKTTKGLEAARVAEKEPFLILERAVDGFFNQGKELLASKKVVLNSNLTTYQVKKAAEERKRREEAEAAAKAIADKAAADALALEQAGKVHEADAQLQTAVAAEKVANKAATIATFKPAAMHRSVGSSGAKSSLRTVWVAQVTDRQELDLDALRPYFSEDALQKAVNAFMAAGGRKLAGAVIEEQSQSVVR